MPEHALAHISLFEKLDAEELTQLETIVKRRMFGAGTVVFFENDLSDSMYVILSGSTKVYTKVEDGMEKILGTLGKGEVFGEYSLIDGHPRSASVETLEPTEVLSISHKDFRQFTNKSPDILWKVLESLTERMRRQNAEQLEYAFRDVPYRLLKVLAQLADKHGETTPQGCKLKLKLKPSDLAGMVGAHPNRIERLLAKFQNEGLIKIASGEEMLIPDAKALRRALEYAADWS